MDFRRFDINLEQADGVRCTQFFKTRIYAIISIVNNSPSKQRTSLGKYRGNKNPTWDSRSAMRFYLQDFKLQQNNLVLMIQLRQKPIIFHGGDKIIGEVYLPLKELYDNHGGAKSYCGHQVTTLSGKPQGFVYFTYEFGEVFRAAANEVDSNFGVFLGSNQAKATPSAPCLDYLSNSSSAA